MFERGPEQDLGETPALAGRFDGEMVKIKTPSVAADPGRSDDVPGSGVHKEKEPGLFTAESPLDDLDRVAPRPIGHSQGLPNRPDRFEIARPIIADEEAVAHGLP
jgi:hypothetical protein